MTIRKLLALLMALAVSGEFAAAQSAAVKAVFRKGNDLFTMGADGRAQQLTKDGISKGYALWSKDGTKIAFLRRIDQTIALDNLIVVGAKSGQVLADIRICPVSPTEAYSVSDIRGIEWLTEDKIAAVGSVNPSTAQTFVYDIRTGRELADYTDDEGGAVFSPDGEHAASLNGSPHWTPDSETEPELAIDHRRVYPARGLHVSFLSAPAWSEASLLLAIVAENYQSKRRSVVVCGVGGDCKSAALPVGNAKPEDDFEVRWIGDRVVAAAPEESWSWLPGSAGVVPTEKAPSAKPDMADVKLPLPTTVKDSEDDAVFNLLKEIHKLGGVEPEIWCSNCSIATRSGRLSIQ
jgi:hypothetical protein